jgi:hypothetical protein
MTLSRYFSSSDSAFGYNGWSFPNGTKQLAKPNTTTTSTCTNCLFDIIADPSELRDVASAHPDIVAKLSAQLRSYHYYTNASMTKQELQVKQEKTGCAPLITPFLN